MPFDLPEELKKKQLEIREFMDAEIAPVVDELDRKGPLSYLENIEFFKTILECLESHDTKKGVTAMHEYVMAEKDFVLSVIDNSKYAHYIE